MDLGKIIGENLRRLRTERNLSNLFQPFLLRHMIPLVYPYFVRVR